MLEYIEGKTVVKLDGRVCGEIRPVDGGYQYFPKGSKSGGEVFASIASVKNSLQM